MVTEPQASPGRYTEQVAFGVVVALASFISYLALSHLYFLVAGVLAGNAFTTIGLRQVRRSWSRLGRARRLVTHQLLGSVLAIPFVRAPRSPTASNGHR